MPSERLTRKTSPCRESLKSYHDRDDSASAHRNAQSVTVCNTRIISSVLPRGRRIVYPDRDDFVGMNRNANVMVLGYCEWRTFRLLHQTRQGRGLRARRNRELHFGSFPRPFIETKKQRVPILRFFHGGQHYVLRVQAHERHFSRCGARVRTERESLQFGVEFISPPHGERLLPVAAVRVERISEVLMPAVGVRVGPGGRTQQRKPQHIALSVISVFGIVDQAETVRPVAQIRPAQGRYFEFGGFP